MSDTTVKQLATLVGISAEQLLSQMAGAGIDKSSPDDVVTDDESRNYSRTFVQDKQKSLQNQPK